MTFDAIVLGLGGMGSAAAFHLARRGKRVLGLEQFTSPHDRGSSHGASRIIRQAYHENPAYVPLVQRAYTLWEQLERDSGRNLLQLTGGLMIGPPESSIVTGTIQSAEQHDLPYEILSAAEIQQRYPVLRPRPDDLGVFEERAGFVRPEDAVRAHLELAARYRAELHFEELVHAWTAHPGNGVSVTTSRGSYQADRLVIAPGAWAPRLLSELAVPFEIRRHVMCWFHPLTEDHLDFSPNRFPIYIWDVDGTSVFYGFPAIDGVAGGIKAAMHSGGDICLPESLHEASWSSEVMELQTHLSRFIPSLSGTPIKAVPCPYTLTPDEHFVVSLHPAHPQVTVAAGFSGHGFKFTTVIGEVLADLVTQGVTAHPIDFLSPARFAVTAA